MDYLKYHPSMDALSERELDLLNQAVDSTQDLISVTPELSDIDYASRGAHAKGYAYIKGSFRPTPNKFPIELPDFLKSEKKALIRLSNANNVITPEKRSFPAYGLSLKLEGEGQVANFPLVNFPVFPTNQVAEFLQVFIDLNRLRVAQARDKRNLLKRLPSFFSSSASLLYHTNGKEMFSVIAKALSLHNKFLLDYKFYSMACFRMGEHIIKLRVVSDFDFGNQSIPYIEGLQSNMLQDILKEKDLFFRVECQLATNEEVTPVNKLTEEWNQKDAPYHSLGVVKIPKQTVLVHTPAMENQDFNPFLNPESLLPVGKIQQTRKPVYEIAAASRRTMNNFY